MTSADPFDLDRFRVAQAHIFAEAIEELRRGLKEGHWIWFVFPQMRGLGRSAMADRFGIGSAAEAKAFLADPVLGPRLETAVRALLDRDAPPLDDRLGALDALKFRSSMTLFERVADEPGLFAEALDRLCGGDRDPSTLALLDGSVGTSGLESGG